MLQSIHIENVALIKKLDIDLSPAFCAFTGETGAGKSIIIDSIGVLCGNKVSKDLIRNGEDYLTVEGLFSDLGARAREKCLEIGVATDDDGTLYISRTVKADGKGIVRIGGKQVSLSVLKEIFPILINIHGQHDSQELLIKEKQRAILDSYCENSKELENYTKAFGEYLSVKRDLDEINVDESQKLRRIEMLKFQINDISSMKLKVGEEEKLNEERHRLLNTEKLAQNCAVVSESLNGQSMGAYECISRAVEALKNLSRISDEYSEYADELSDIKSRVLDISERITDSVPSEYDNPTLLLDKIEARLDGIAKLERKYGPDIESVLEYLEKAKGELDELENFDRRSAKLNEKLKECASMVKKCAQILSDSRIRGAESLKENVEKCFKYLDMPSVKFKASIKNKPFARDGADEIEFFVMTNSGEGYSPLAKTASGGELSRIMLAIKSIIAEKDGVDTLIFDEVDTGISGKTSRKIALMMNKISAVSQVLCVTHSAQICSVAFSHYLVSKEENEGRTTTRVSLLDENERVRETARIIAGIDITESSLKAARELINCKTE